MGTWFSKIHNLFTEEYVPPPSCKILLLGLDGAGKTTILYKVKLNLTIQTISTIGFNVETIDPINDIHFTVWDVCGQEKDRPFWRHFFQDVLGFVFVVDSSDIDRLEEARNELHTVVNREENKDIPFVVIANKQDLPRKTSILYKLKLNQTIQTTPTVGCNVETIDSKNGITFIVWDVCGQEKIRKLWRHYFHSGTGVIFVVDSNDRERLEDSGVIFVVDSNDRERLEEARYEFHILINNEQIKDVPFVVIANKQDLPNALKLSEVADGLELHKLTNTK